LAEIPDRGPPGSPLSRRVLIVDDHVDAAETMALLLQLEGHDVAVAHDGPAALAAAQAMQPTLVLLDIGLPGMDGYQVARRLRMEVGLQDVLLVALTGWSEDDQQRTHDAGFDERLVKPISPQSLRQLFSHPKLLTPRHQTP
jgi:CheY-like chemotaxis protein